MLALLTIPALLGAQAPTANAALIQRELMAAGARVDETHLRVTASGDTHRVRYGGFTGDRLILRFQDGDLRVAASEVTSLDVGTYRRGRWTFGSAVAGAALAASAAAFASAAEPCDYCFSPGWAAILAAPVGLVAGGVVGFTIGSFRRYWVPVYP